MKAAVYYSTGPPDVFRYEDVPDPHAEPGAALMLVAFRQIELRKITGHQHVAAPLTENALTDEAA